MSEYLMMLIGYNLQNSADWRRDKAKQFPEDTRNLRAAEELDHLAAEIEKLEGSAEIHQQICDLEERINKLDDDDGFRLREEISETVSEELRSIGFHNGYETGVQFLEWYRDLLQEKLQDQLDQAVPVPDLDEQVANEPAVKAAKQAYDEAYAKALAEARKRL
jgi:hypothetical protein